jgi:hypothetical protein
MTQEQELAWNCWGRFEGQTQNPNQPNQGVGGEPERGSNTYPLRLWHHARILQRLWKWGDWWGHRPRRPQDLMRVRHGFVVL